jgi:hypothetical protein
MSKQDITLPANFPEGYENHNWKNTKTNFDELYARTSSLETTTTTQSQTIANQETTITTLSTTLTPGRIYGLSLIFG